MRPPLTTSMTLPLTGSPDSAARLDALPRELEAGALLREDEPALGVLLREDERVDLLADRDLVGGVHRPPDRQLGDGDDAFGLVADVDEHLVLVHAHDRAVHDLALVDLREGSVVVGDELPVGACRPDPFFGGSGLFGDVVRHRIAEYSRMQRKSRSSAFRASGNARPVRITLVRSATVIVELAGKRILVDPMLDDVGARPPIEGTRNQVANPTVPLAVPGRGGRARPRRVIVTHRHRDHLDTRGEELLPRDIPVFCQPEDEEALRDARTRCTAGRRRARVGRAARSRARRRATGSGAIAELLAPVSGSCSTTSISPATPSGTRPSRRRSSGTSLASQS